MTIKQKLLVKSTIPILKEHGVLLTSHFYDRMFNYNPELKHMFNTGNQHNNKQRIALAAAILSYAEHIDNPSVLMPMLNTIWQKHTSLNVRYEHYSIIGKHLIESIKEVLKDAATKELVEAWALAYQQLSDIMINNEQDIYNKNTFKEGGWTGWRTFIVKKKIKESSEVTSFYLYPSDGGNVADFIPGQYVSVRVFIPELNLMQPRQYSISCSPNDSYYRISIKREMGDNCHIGIISNYMHDHVNEGDVVDLSAPAGTFTLRQAKVNTKVFISGGVGQTPLLSMLEHVVSLKNYNQSIIWVHGCRDEQVHAFKSRLDEISIENPFLKQYVFYDAPITPENIQYKGWVDLSIIKKEVLHNSAEYYICGPSPFIKKHFEFLISNGIAKEDIYFEEFSPTSLTLD